MASEEQLIELLITVQNVNYHNIVECIVVSICYGIYLPLFMLSCKPLCPKTHSFKTRLLLLVISLVFIFYTLHVSAVIGAYLTQGSWPRTTPEDLFIIDRLRSGNAMSIIPRKFSGFGQFMLFIFGDAIVIWRAYVICVSYRWKRVILICLLICNTCLALALAIFEASQSTEAYQLNGPLLFRLEGGFNFVSFGVNLIATGIIAKEASSLHRAFAMTDNDARSSPVMYLLFLLTEGGIFLCIFQLLNAVMNLCNADSEPTDPLNLATISFTSFAVAYAAIYPSLVIILVEHRVSPIDMSVISTLPPLSPVIASRDKEEYVREPGMSVFTEGSRTESSTV